VLEGYGGDIPYIEVSSKNWEKHKELLDLILLMFDMHKKSDYDTQISAKNSFSAIVIEAKLDARTGPKATIVVKNGKIKNP